MVFRGKSVLLFKRMRLASPNPLDDLETRDQPISFHHP